MTRILASGLLAIILCIQALGEASQDDSPFTVRVSAITQLGDLSYVGLIDAHGKSYLIKEGSESDGFSVIEVDYAKSLVAISYKNRRFECQISGEPKKVPVSTIAEIRSFLDQAGVDSREMRALIESNPDAVILVNDTLLKPVKSKPVVGLGEGIQSMFSSQELARIEERKLEGPNLTNANLMILGEQK